MDVRFYPTDNHNFENNLYIKQTWPICKLPQTKLMSGKLCVSDALAEENYINKNNTVWERKGRDKTLDKENSYPGLPKLHLTCSRCWIAQDTRF